LDFIKGLNFYSGPFLFYLGPKLMLEH